MAYVSDNPSFTAKSENSVSRKGDINREPPNNITIDIKKRLSWLTYLVESPFLQKRKDKRSSKQTLSFNGK
jgi:hypothetical protein